MTVDDIMDLADHFGDNMTDATVEFLMDAIRRMSLADRQYLYDNLTGPLYTAVSMNIRECGYRPE